MPLLRLILAALLVAAPAAATAQDFEPEAPRAWSDDEGDWRRRAAAEADAMQAVGELFEATRPAPEANARPQARRMSVRPSDEPPLATEDRRIEPSLFFE